jgi:superfamily II DNA/RNA helicase
MHNKGGNPICTLGACQVLILDEADRMLDMGFEKDIRSIVSAMKSSKVHLKLPKLHTLIPIPCRSCIPQR